MTYATGELVISTIAMPKDTNASGDIFGGWLVSQMDLGAAVFAYKNAHERVTTVAIDKLEFIKPVKIGDVVECYASLIKTGRSSMHIKMQGWVRRRGDSPPEQVTEGTFVFVAIDNDGKPKPVFSK